MTRPIGGMFAKEEASELVEHWVRENAARDAQWKILAIECGFVIALDLYTYIIGVQDLIATDFTQLA